MGNRKNPKSKRITIVAIALVLGFAVSYWAVSASFGSKAEAGTAEGAAAESKMLQSNEEIPAEQPINTGNGTKYLTVSRYNNIDITVNYLSPLNKEKDNLVFDVRVDTHSVDLSKYKDIRKYIELQTDSGITISDGFEWSLESSGGHHFSGILKIKNEIEGKRIVDSDTKSFKLVFKNIGDAGVREHVYEGDKLK